VRMSLHTKKSFGVTSLKSGELEVMLDRKLGQDDGRGLGEPIFDSVPMNTVLYLSFENVPLQTRNKVPDGHNHMIPSNPTVYSHYLIHLLNYPLHMLFGKTTSLQNGGFDWENMFTTKPLSMAKQKVDLPFHLVALKIHEGDKSKLVSHAIQLAYDKVSEDEIYDWDVLNTFGTFEITTIKEETLTLMHEVQEEHQKGTIFHTKCAYCVDLRTFLLTVNPTIHDHQDLVKEIGNGEEEQQQLQREWEEMRQKLALLERKLEEEQRRNQRDGLEWLKEKEKLTKEKDRLHIELKEERNRKKEDALEDFPHNHLRDDWSILSVMKVSGFFTFLMSTLYCLGLLKNVLHSRNGQTKLLIAFITMHMSYFTFATLHLI